MQMNEFPLASIGGFSMPDICKQIQSQSWWLLPLLFYVLLITVLFVQFYFFEKKRKQQNTTVEKILDSIKTNDEGMDWDNLFKLEDTLKEKRIKLNTNLKDYFL